MCIFGLEISTIIQLQSDSGRSSATRAHARFRLARVVGEDGSTLADSDIDAIANQIRHDQTVLIARGMEQVVNTAWAQKGPASKKARSSKATDISGDSSKVGILPDQILVSGHGDFLVERTPCGS